MSSTLKIKVCGMRQLDNIKELVKLNPDYMGFIFYPPSKRFVGKQLSKEVLENIPPEIQKTGVFVDTPLDEVLETAYNNDLQAIQLHGNETPEMCMELRKEGYIVIKAFAPVPGFNWQSLEPYYGSVNYFLFDTPSEAHGGSGESFNWLLLNYYQGPVPFILSGGIGPEDVEKVKSFQHPQLYAIDINSKFETDPAQKDINALTYFFKEFKY